MIRLAVCDCRT